MLVRYLSLIVSSRRQQTSGSSDSFILHGTGNGNGTGTETGNNGFIYYVFSFTHYTETGNRREKRTGEPWVAYPFPRSWSRFRSRAVCMSHKLEHEGRCSHRPIDFTFWCVRLKTKFTKFKECNRQQTKLRKGNVFTGFCLFIGGAGGGCK